MLLSRACSCSVFESGSGGEGGDVSVLDLNGRVILTNNTDHNYVIANNGLGALCVAVLLTVDVSTVYQNACAAFILDDHVAVGGVLDLNDNTARNVLFFGILIVLLSRADLNEILNGGDNLGKLDGKLLGVGCVAAGCGNGYVYGDFLIGNNDGELAVLNGCGAGSVIGSPGKGNVIVILTGSGKLDYLVGGQGSIEGSSFELSCNLVSGSYFYFHVVGEGGCGHRNEVGSAVEKNQNTGCVSLVSEVIGVILIDAGLVFCLHGGGEVGNVGSYVSGLVVQLEVEILGGILIKLLGADGNALDGYGQTNVCAKVSAGCELLGDIEDFYFLNGAVNDSNLTVLDLLHAGVGGHIAGNLYGHTNLDTQLCGIFFDAVAVVTAGYGGVSQVEVVVLVACFLGVDGNNDTLNGELVVLLCCHVLCVRVHFILGNGKLEGNGLGGAVTSLDGCGKLVAYFLGGFFVYVNDNLAVCRSTNGNLISINRPIDLISNAADHNLRNDFVVNCGNDEILFVEAFHVSSCAVEVIGDCGRGSGGCSAVFRFLGSAGCEHRAQKSCYEQECKKFFHNCLLCLCNFLVA